MIKVTINRFFTAGNILLFNLIKICFLYVYFQNNIKNYLRKRLSFLKAFKSMVGRERFERSTSGLKVRWLSPYISTSRDVVLYNTYSNNNLRFSYNNTIIAKNRCIPPPNRSSPAECRSTSCCRTWSIRRCHTWRRRTFIIDSVFRSQYSSIRY